MIQNASSPCFLNRFHVDLRLAPPSAEAWASGMGTVGGSTGCEEITIDKSRGGHQRSSSHSGHGRRVPLLLLPMTSPKTELVSVRFSVEDRALLKSIARQRLTDEASLMRHGFRLVVLELQMQNKLIQELHKHGKAYPPEP